MIKYPVWIPPSGQELCMVDSKGRIFKKSKPESLSFFSRTLIPEPFMYPINLCEE
uniref:Uncharacterized protein n=1 Tax=Sus scrofa TaxID=9823 RepID=A0A4X1ULR4_PIG